MFYLYIIINNTNDMKAIDYKLTTKFNGNYTTRFANFSDGTYAKLVVLEKRGLKYNNYTQVSVEGDFDKTKINVSMGTLGEMVVTPISSEKAETGKKLNHKAFGEVEVLSSENGILRIKLADGEEKSVMEKFFMNGVK